MWEVSTDSNEQVTYSPATLITQFIGTLSKNPERYDQMLLIEEISKTLPNEVIKDMTIENFIALGFKFGYIYRLFLEKNNVELPQPMSEATTPSDERP